MIIAFVGGAPIHPCRERNLVLRTKKLSLIVREKFKDKTNVEFEFDIGTRTGLTKV